MGRERDKPMPGEQDGSRQQRLPDGLGLLAAVARQLLVASTSEELLPAVFELLTMALGLEVYLCYLLERPENSLRLVAHAGVPAETAVRCEWLKLNEPPNASSAQNPTPRVATDTDAVLAPAREEFQALGLTA